MKDERSNEGTGMMLYQRENQEEEEANDDCNRARYSGRGRRKLNGSWGEDER